MECFECGKTIEDGSVFCNYCGTSQKLVCPDCGKRFDVESCFCNMCGTELAPMSAVSRANFEIEDGVLKSYVGRNVAIPDGIVKIEENAFRGRKYIVNVIIPNSVKEIGARAFYGCTSLKNINIPESVDKIGDEAFYNCSSLNMAISKMKPKKPVTKKGALKI